MFCPMKMAKVKRENEGKTLEEKLFRQAYPSEEYFQHKFQTCRILQVNNSLRSIDCCLPYDEPNSL